VPLAFSTCWNSSRHLRGEEMLAEISSLGFDHVELGHGIRMSLWEGVERFLADHPLKVTSLHNFCPLPVEIPGAAPDYYECTAVRTEVRERARILTLRTIDFARKLGVRNVVMHLGSTRMPPYTKRLCELINSGQYLNRSYIATKLKAIRKREANSPYDRIIDWLKPILEHAASAGVVLGIENRIGIETCPSEREFRRLFAELGATGYWHDFGHAQIRHNLTFIDHAEWLREMSSHLIGCHVHDVIFPYLDHQAPFSGMIDFAPLIAAIPPGIPLVWELSPGATKDEIVSALAHWKQKFTLLDNSSEAESLCP
jgi:sugar phosphate isomerase/epimerase